MRAEFSQHGYCPKCGSAIEVHGDIGRCILCEETMGCPTIESRFKAIEAFINIAPDRLIIERLASWIEENIPGSQVYRDTGLIVT